MASALHINQLVVSASGYEPEVLANNVLPLELRRQLQAAAAENAAAHLAAAQELLDGIPDPAELGEGDDEGLGGHVPDPELGLVAEAGVAAPACDAKYAKLLLVACAGFMATAFTGLIVDVAAQGKVHEALNAGDSPVAFAFYSGLAGAALSLIGGAIAAKTESCCFRP